METIGIIAGISNEVIRREVAKKGYQTCIITGRENEVGTDKADKFLIKDFKEKEEILEYLKKNKISKIILGTGHVLAFKLAKYLKENGIKISIDPEKSLIAKDKDLYKKELKNKGFLTPNSILIEKNKTLSIELLEKIKYPVVVKSTIDTLYPQKVLSKDEVLLAITEVQNTNSDVLIEEYIQGIDITVPVYSNYDETKAVLVSYYSKAKECKLKGFSFTGAEEQRLSSEIENKVMKYSEEVVKEMGTIGMVRLDIIVNSNNEFYILECNSVMVTGVHPNQIEYGKEFLEKENINFAKYTVENALKIFDYDQN